MNDIFLKQFGLGHGELRTFEKGSFELLTVRGVTIGKAIDRPGWNWSEHVRGPDDPATCPVEHVGLALKGQCAVKMDDGEMLFVKPGDFLNIPPRA